MGITAALDLGAQFDRLWDAIANFAENLARIDLPYLAVALALSLALQLCRARAWANALHAAYPDGAVSDRGVIGAQVAGHDAEGRAVIQEDGPPPRVQRIALNVLRKLPQGQSAELDALAQKLAELRRKRS